MSTNVARSWAQSHESGANCYRGSLIFRADRIRMDAARLNRQCLTRAAKVYAPLLSPQKVSGARVNGGAVAEVGLQFLADPHNALVVAEHLHALARSITQSITEPLLVVLLRESRADSAEDVTQDELLCDPTNLEKLREHEAALVRAIAEAQKALDVVRRDIAERERGSA